MHKCFCVAAVERSCAKLGRWKQLLVAIALYSVTSDAWSSVRRKLSATNRHTSTVMDPVPDLQLSGVAQSTTSGQTPSENPQGLGEQPRRLSAIPSPSHASAGGPRRLSVIPSPSHASAGEPRRLSVIPSPSHVPGGQPRRLSVIPSPSHAPAVSRKKTFKLRVKGGRSTRRRPPSEVQLEQMEFSDEGADKHLAHAHKNSPPRYYYRPENKICTCSEFP